MSIAATTVGDAVAGLDYSGIALVIAAIGVAISSVVTAIKTAKTVKQIHTQTTAIDNAVNGKIPGAQTIGQDVIDLHDEMKDTQSKRSGNGGE